MSQNSTMPTTLPNAMAKIVLRFWSQMYFFTLILDLSDYGTDVMVATLLQQETSTQWWFKLTLMLILVPLFLVNLFSLFWFWQDHRSKPNEIRLRAINGKKSVTFGQGKNDMIFGQGTVKSSWHPESECLKLA